MVVKVGGQVGKITALHDITKNSSVEPYIWGIVQFLLVQKFLKEKPAVFHIWTLKLPRIPKNDKLIVDLRRS